MTSLVVWVGVDQRGPASMYIATDSRITWPSRGPHWDYGRKTYSTNNAHIFGYVGDVLFPALMLPGISQQVELLGDTQSVEHLQDSVCSMIVSAWRHTPRTIRGLTQIIHCARVGTGMDATFCAQVLSLPEGGEEWSTQLLQVPSYSSKIEFLGSGTPSIKSSYGTWIQPEGDPRDRTSRAVFSAFCDAIDSGVDSKTGGAPQIVGLYRVGSGRDFGVHWKDATYLHGAEIAEELVSCSTENRNRWFERVDKYGILLPGAQKHAKRPT